MNRIPKTWRYVEIGGAVFGVAGVVLFGDGQGAGALPGGLLFAVGVLVFVVGNVGAWRHYRRGTGEGGNE